MTLTIDIYEPRSGDVPVVRHVFFGDSQNNIMKIVDAHARTDVFLRCAIQKGMWHNIPLRIQSRWEE